MTNDEFEIIITGSTDDRRRLKFRPKVADSSSGVGFGLVNLDGAAVITIGTGLAVNALSLTLSNLSSLPLPLRGGPAVAEEHANADSPSTLYLHFGDLLSVRQQADLGIQAPGWSAGQLGEPATWSLAPNADTSLAAGQSVTFAITGVDASPPAATGHLTIDFINLAGIPDGFQQILVARQNPRNGKDLRLGLDLRPKEITVTSGGDPSVVNRLLLTISNPSATSPIVPPDAPPDPDHPPTFYLSFIYGAPPGGYFALTTPQLGQQMTVNLAEEGSDRWKVDPQPTGRYPVWTLRPLAKEILGVGEDAFVQFTIDNIVSALPPGPTQLYLQHANLPGYADGADVRIIQKEAQLAISEFGCKPIWAAPSVPTTVELSWKVEGEPESLELRGPQSFDVTGRSRFLYPTELETNTPFVLHATRGNRFADANTQFENVELQTELDVPIKPYPVGDFDSMDASVVCPSHRWDTIYVAMFDLISIGGPKGRGGLGILDGRTGALIKDISSPVTPDEFQWLWQAPPVVPGVDRLAVAAAESAQIWDLSEGHTATKVSLVKFPDGTGMLGFLPNGDLLLGGVVDPPNPLFKLLRQDPLGQNPPAPIFTYDGDTIFLKSALSADGKYLVCLGWDGAVGDGAIVGTVVMAKLDLTTGKLVEQVSVGQWPLVSYQFLLSASGGPVGSGYLFAISLYSAKQQDALARLQLRFGIRRLAALADKEPDDTFLPLSPPTQLIHVPFDGSGRCKALPMTAPLFDSISIMLGMAPQSSPNGTDVLIPGAGGFWFAPIEAPPQGSVVNIGDPSTVVYSSHGNSVTLLTWRDDRDPKVHLVRLGRTLVGHKPKGGHDQPANPRR